MADTPITSEPITLPNGQQIMSYDDNTVQVASPGGGSSMTIARNSAPAHINAAIDAAQLQSLQPAASAIPQIDTTSPPANIAAAPVTPSPAQLQAPAGNPSGWLDTSTPVTPAAQVPTHVAPAQAPAEQQEPTDPLAAAQAQLHALREVPQTMATSGGVHTSTSTTSIPDAARKDIATAQVKIDEAASDEQKAIESQAKREEEITAKKADLIAADAANVQNHLAAQEADDRAKEQRIQVETTKLDRLNKDANTQIDPGRWWKRADTGTKILAGISAFLGGFAQGYSGGKVGNPALDAINKAIDDDVEAQLQNRAGAERAAGRQGTLIDKVREAYADKNQQRQALLILAHDSVARQVDSLSARLQSQTAQARGAQGSAAIREQNAVRVQNLIAQTSGSQTVTKTQTPGGGVVESPNARAADALEKSLYADYDPKLFIPGSEAVLGKPLQATQPEAATDVNKSIAGTKNLLSLSNQLLAQYADGPTLSPTKRANIKRIRATMKTQLSVQEQLGALSGGDNELLDDQLGPNGSDYSTVSDAQRVVRGFQASLRQAVLSNLSSKAVPVNPDRVPVTARAAYRGGTGTAFAAAPQTKPIMEER